MIQLSSSDIEPLETEILRRAEAQIASARQTPLPAKPHHPMGDRPRAVQLPYREEQAHSVSSRSSVSSTRTHHARPAIIDVENASSDEMRDDEVLDSEVVNSDGTSSDSDL
eukprot:gnl/MRDRNA2_/MRDRNA2_86509_c0_seq1.p1 gnl/MRDRNA2_/MRDRNA2_86509_c0~~gnl/MRDRNA2_/MRDRNA2_86509_c0_seq1.p1  ORF type:complete len:111 (+),score=15.02 gnl/MRDRNA2_/MRDRNA2_86509_c0_seq1:439-771(+)